MYIVVFCLLLLCFCQLIHVKEKEIVLINALQKLLNLSMENHLAVLPVEYVIKTVLMEQFSKIAMEDML